MTSRIPGSSVEATYLPFSKFGVLRKNVIVGRFIILPCGQGRPAY